MRITGGNQRGRPISSPDGLKTRPTSDRAREAIFNILCHARWLPGAVMDGGNVLDLFAGTGALGLDALSRGAAHAIFVENDPASARTCQKNIDALSERGSCSLMRADATTLSPRPVTVMPRNLVFLDPPYGKGMGTLALSNAATKRWLAEDAVCVFEMAKKEPEDIPAGFTLQDERAYGVALVRFLIYTGR